MTYQKGTRDNILDLAEQGKTQKQIAAEIGCSQKTVSNVFKEDGRARTNDLPGTFPWKE